MMLGFLALTVCFGSWYSDSREILLMSLGMKGFTSAPLILPQSCHSRCKGKINRSKDQTYLMPNFSQRPRRPLWSLWTLENRDTRLFSCNCFPF